MGMDRATIIITLDRWRNSANLDKLGVARRLGCSRQLVSAWLNPNHTLTPSAEQLANFGLVCGVGSREVGAAVLQMVGITTGGAIADSADVHSGERAA